MILDWLGSLAIWLLIGFPVIPFVGVAIYAIVRKLRGLPVIDPEQAKWNELHSWPQTSSAAMILTDGTDL